MPDSFRPILSWLGELDYGRAHALQLEAAAQAPELWRQRRTVRVFGLEHSDVITLGKRGDAAADLHHPREWLASNGVAVVKADRGGQATLHSPGQLVIYPIIPLRDLGFGARAYVRLMEETTVACLGRIGVYAEPNASEPGIYTKRGKIAFFGVRIERGVSRHGVSINVTNDLSRFDLIRSCGRVEARFDRTADNGVSETTEAIFRIWADLFWERLGQKIQRA